MEFDRETIYGIVHDGQYTLAETETLQGAKLSSEQRGWWREATILKKANAAKAKDRQTKIDEIAAGGPMTAAERERKMLALRASIDEVLDDALSRVNRERRLRVTDSLLEFVREYGCDEGAFLEEPPSEKMATILVEMQTAADDSSVPYHIRVARGHGKTSYAKLACAWAAATGRRKFIVVVGSNTQNAMNIVGDIFTFFSESPKFAVDFPEVAIPLASINGVYQRAKSQTYRGRPTKMKLGLGQIVLPTIEKSPASGCIIQGVGFATSARGKVRGKQRPDLVVLDDLQTDDLAGNEERVMAAAEHVKKTFLGLAGHRRKIAAIMTSTPIEPDDLSEVFARDPAWKTTTHKMVLSWPNCWKPDDSENHWAVYRDIMRRETLNGNKRPHVVANEYYAAHRAEMDDGAEVLNPTNFDAKTELSGIQHAMNILFRDGEAAFDSEYQMAPRRHAFAFEISAELIMSRVRRGVAPLTVPEWTDMTVAATDINPSYGLTTTVVCFGADRTALVTAYHVTKVHIDDSANDTEYHAKMYDALAAHGRELRNAIGKMKLDVWAMDAGGKQIKPVCAFTDGGGMACETSGAVRSVAMIGRAWRSWNDRPRNSVRSARNFTVPVRGEQGRRYTLWNADYYKEAAQKCWATEVGGAGGCSLFDGGVNHASFAIQVANERLKIKRKLVDGYDYKWKTREPHDYGDCMAMCYAVAGADGITGEKSYSQKKQVPDVLFLD